MLVEVGGKFRIGNPKPARRIEQPGAIDHAVLGIVKAWRQRKDDFGRAGQIVADLARETRHQCKPQRHIADGGGRKAWIDPVGHMHIEPGHHQARIHQRGAQEPVDPRAPVLIEGEGQRREAKSHDHDNLKQALVAAIAGPGGDSLEHRDQIIAAANGEDFDHDKCPGVCSRGRKSVGEGAALDGARPVERGGHARRHLAREQVLDEGCLLDDLHDRADFGLGAGLPVGERLAHDIDLTLPQRDLGFVGADEARHRPAGLADNAVEHRKEQIDAGDLGQSLAVIGRHASAVSSLDRQDLVERYRGDLEQFLLRVGDGRVVMDRLNHAVDQRGHAWAKRLGRRHAKR